MDLLHNMKCPECQSSLLKLKQGDDGKQYLYCYRVLKCGWNEEIMPPLRLVPRAKKY